MQSYVNGKCIKNHKGIDLPVTYCIAFKQGKGSPLEKFVEIQHRSLLALAVEQHTVQQLCKKHENDTVHEKKNTNEPIEVLSGRPPPPTGAYMASYQWPRPIDLAGMPLRIARAPPWWSTVRTPRPSSHSFP